jgi:hypothetical protein
VWSDAEYSLVAGIKKLSGWQEKKKKGLKLGFHPSPTSLLFM